MMVKVSPGYFIDLAKAVEESTGPSPVYDREIWETICQQTGNPYHLNGEPKWPAYTASLDAAMTLVPNDYEYEIGSANLVGTFWTILTNMKREIRVGGCKTPALALTAAALRARASMESGNE